MRGFLCTCNFHEKDCVRDAYKLLNEFADEIYGPDAAKEPAISDDKGRLANEDESADRPESKDDEDISTALNKEINQLITEHAKPVAARRFQVVETGAKSVIFVKSTLPNPLELVTKIVTELDKTKQQRTRYLLRLLPIEVICKANTNDIKLKANALFEKYFSQEPKTFSIIVNRHNNNSLQRDEIIEDLAGIISKKNPGNKADLKNPEIAVLVEVIRGNCLLSIAPNYYKFKKYNLVEICNTKEQKEEVKKTSPEKVEDLKSDVETTKEVSKEDVNLSEDAADEEKETKDEDEKRAE